MSATEVYKFLGIYNLLRVNHKETENQNRPIKNKETASAKKKVSYQRKAQDLMASLLKSTKHLRTNLSQNTKKEYFQTHFMRQALP
jgi:hypothetical protein